MRLAAAKIRHPPHPFQSSFCQYHSAFRIPLRPSDLQSAIRNEQSILLTPELKQAPESLRLAEILRVELTEADQRQLREWFLAQTLASIQTTTVSENDIANLPDADDGKMIGFVDVFPCGLAPNFNWDNEAWIVDEQYCV